MPFRFRQFSVEDTRSTIRVGTDSMLLGAWSLPGSLDTVLDIGTGCGVLAMMMAQKGIGQIDAIDCDPDSVREAEENFRRSQWAYKLRVFEISLQAFTLLTDRKYDFLICNPPFFSGSPVPLQKNKRIAKHTERLSHQELIYCAKALLSPKGKISLIMPADRVADLLQIAENAGLSLTRRTTVYPSPEKAPHRILMELSLQQPIIIQDLTLTILDPSHSFSKEYLLLTEDFHYFGP